MLNKAILVGRMVADPELRQTPQGVSVTTFRIAVERPFGQGGERKADFLTIVCWRGQAEFVCRYFKKGSDIGIDGTIGTREYTDKEGNRRTAVEVLAERVSFVGRKTDRDTEPAEAKGFANTQGPADYIELDNSDDLPF